MPKLNRSTVWQRLGEEIQAPHWPRLTRPIFIKVGLFLMSIAAYLLPWFWRSGGLKMSELTGEILSMVSVTMVMWVGIVTTRPLKVAFPRGYACVGDIVRSLVALDRRPEKADQGWTREQVRETVRALVTEVFGVTEFTDDSRFVQDMHIDQ